MQPRVIFMGTPDFAAPILQELAGRLGADSLLVVTQPDRAAGRGQKVQPPPVRIESDHLGLEVLQIETFKDPTVRDVLTRYEPDLAVVAAFGRILPKWVLNLPKRGCVNVHASVLPRFRGASPIAAAIARGDAQAGVALMQMEPGLDTGPVYDIAIIDIAYGETTESLTGRLAEAGARLVEEHLDALLEGQLVANPQRGQIIETRRIEKRHGLVDWSRSAVEIDRHVRAMWPWPRAWTVSRDGARIQIHEADVAGDTGGAPGEVLRHDNRGIVVGTGDGALLLRTIQIPGKAAQSASQLIQHPAFAMGSVFGTGGEWPEPDSWIVPLGEA